MTLTAQELAEIIGSKLADPNTPRDGRVIGQRIVVLDRGFVYVGEVTELPDRIVITNAKNIRSWGTTRGLGELVNGPLKDTKLDAVGVVEVYKHAVIHLIRCEGF